MSRLMQLSHLFQFLVLTFGAQVVFAQPPTEASVQSAESGSVSEESLGAALHKKLGIEKDKELEALNQLYQNFLSEHVEPGIKNGLPANMVDYAEAKKDERLGRLLTLLDGYPKERLNTKSKTIAFYLNAYNILAINKVATHWPLSKLKSLGNSFQPVWAHPAGDVCGEAVTLRSLEHEVLRKQGDPRIHFALNCASMSCPDLRLEPYTYDKIEAQLQSQTETFFTQNKGVVVDGNRLRLSKLFDWFSGDFSGHGGVLAFVNHYLPAQSGSWEIESYLTYDWTVNDELSGSELRKIKRNGGNTWFN